MPTLPSLVAPKFVVMKTLGTTTENTHDKYHFSVESEVQSWLNPDSSPVGPRWAPCWPHEPCYQGLYNKVSFPQMYS